MTTVYGVYFQLQADQIYQTKDKVTKANKRAGVHTAHTEFIIKKKQRKQYIQIRN